MTARTDLPLDPREHSPYYWYSTDPVEVSVNGGPWLSTVSAEDPNGASAWKLDLYGPEANGPSANTLKYGNNAVATRIAGVGGSQRYGPMIFVGTPGMWVSPHDPAVVSAIVNGVEDPDFSGPSDWSVELSLKAAQDLLAGLTGSRFHPAGKATEAFQAVPTATRLNPNYQPLNRVISITRQGTWADDIGEINPVDYRIHGHSVLLRPRHNYLAMCEDVRSGEIITLTYTYGSTITAMARNALLYLARQFWLSYNPEAGECEIPDRVTQINREGISYTLIDQQQYLDKGRLGIPKIDQWLATVNPSSARSRSGVYTPDMPPGVRGTRR